jgi:hypothetical protein
MQVNEIGIHAGGVDSSYKEIGEISVKVQAATAFSKTPTIEDVSLQATRRSVTDGRKRRNLRRLRTGHFFDFVQGAARKRAGRVCRIRRNKVPILRRTDQA